MTIDEISKVAVVAPEIVPPSDSGVPPKFHWYVNPVPVATTEKLAADPAHKVCVAIGCVLIDAPTFTVKAEFDDTTVPEHPITSTVYVPASPTTKDEIAKLAVVAPEMVPPSDSGVPPKFHWYVNPVPAPTTLKLAAFPVHKV